MIVLQFQICINCVKNDIRTAIVKRIFIHDFLALFFLIIDSHFKDKV